MVDKTVAAGANKARNTATGDVAPISGASNALGALSQGGYSNVPGLTNNANAVARIAGTSESIVKSQQWAQNAYSKMTDPTAYKLEAGSETQTMIDNAAPYSIINKWSLLSYKGKILDSKPDGTGARWGVGKKLYTKPLYTAASDELNPTAATIIRKCRDNGGPGYQYNSGDFAYCKFYGKIPNNYMVTLRRFPTPCEDDIINATVLDKDGKPLKKEQADIARAITWMSEASENKLSEILKFSVGFEWQDLDSKIQDITPQTPDRGTVGGVLNSSPLLSNIENTARGVSPYQNAKTEAMGAGWDPLLQTYPNHTLGPYNIIKNVRVRDKGLTFAQEFKLVFHYDLRSIGKVNPKLAMLDVMGNMLVLTYNNAPFWGGAARYTSSGTVKKPFGDMAKLFNGDFKGYLTSVQKSFSDGAKNMFGGGKGFIEGMKNFGGNLLGGSLMNLFGKPNGTEAVKAFLTGDSTGSWHVTIGNPLNPIAVIGNLTCTSSDFEFDGPLGYEDFPSKLKVTVNLKPGRYRDKGDIESMFNAGRGRIYLTPSGGLNTDKETIVDVYGKRYPQKGENKVKGRGASGARGGSATGGGTYDNEVTIQDAETKSKEFYQTMKDFANG